MTADTGQPAVEEEHSGDRPPQEHGAGTADGVAALAAEARRLTDLAHPHAWQAWAAAEAAAERTGTVPDERTRAEITEHAALAAVDEPERSAALFHSAAEQFETAGDQGEAAACRARAACARATAATADQALRAADEQCVRLGTLFGLHRATRRQYLGALLLRCRILLRAAADPARKDEALAAAAAQAEDVITLGERHRGEPGVTGRLADATVLLGRLAAARHEGPRAAVLLARAAALHLEAGQPWCAVEPAAALAELCLRQGDAAGAARWARAALGHGDTVLEAPHRAHLHLLAAEALTRLGQDEDVVGHAREAARWADDAGEGAGPGAGARLRLGGALRRLGRAREAAGVLESVMPDLERAGDQGEYVQARWWLAECRLDLGEAREAAEQFLLAAGVAGGWEHPHDHAMLTNLAADALNRAGLHEESAGAYARAEDLWRAAGDRAPGPEERAQAALAVVRTLRARAWLELHEDRGGLPAARAYMTAALLGLRAELDRRDESGIRQESGVGDETEGAGQGAGTVDLFTALADTYRQTAEIVMREADTDDPRPAYREALELVRQAVGILTPLGPAGRDDRASDLLLAARLESALDRPGTARAAAEAAVAAYDGVQDSAAAACRKDASALLAGLPAGHPV
ncbi:hypothetical protein [Actinacidiphila acidipaludis]|uniref:Tetratricopeptide repeat protein n=1 Tax=Actinacidiphila acidipaludis TaxID=2873382 RepID=A0ABS7Q569_9ACTN|nr:hypothetical protein [Streptomyces acidipaludis]MBY8878305.1 hypothetical protein [Streptomyces acidipaludis]